MTLQLANLKHSLTEVLALEQAQQTLSRLVDAFGHVLRSLERAFVDPFLDILLVLFEVHGSHVFIGNLIMVVSTRIRAKTDCLGSAYDESLNLESLCNDLHQVSDRVVLAWRLVVVGDHAASHDSTEWIHGVNRCFELFASDLIPISIEHRPILSVMLTFS